MALSQKSYSRNIKKSQIEHDMLWKVEDQDDHYQKVGEAGAQNQLEGGSNDQAETPVAPADATAVASSSRLDFDPVRLSEPDAAKYIRELMAQQSGQVPRPSLDYVTDDGEGLCLEQRNHLIEEEKPKSFTETKFELNITKIKTLFAAHSKMLSEKGVPAEEGKFQGKLCEQFELQDSGVKAFLVENQYFFITAGIEKSTENGKTQARSVMTIHKYEPEDLSQPLKQIHEVALNNVKTTIYAQQAKTYAICGSSIYYFVIENNLEAKRVTYRLIKFMLKKETAVEVKKWTEEAPLDSNKKPLHACFVSFANQTIDTVDKEESNEGLLNQQTFREKSNTLKQRKQTLFGPLKLDKLKSSSYAQNLRSMILPSSRTSLPAALEKVGSAQQDWPQLDTLQALQEREIEEEEAFCSSQFISIAKNHKYNSTVLYSIRRIGDFRELESLEPKTRNGQKLQLQHISKKDLAQNTHGHDMLSLHVHGENDTKKEAQWFVIDNQGDITLAVDDQQSEVKDRISYRPWYIFTSTWDHDQKKKYLSDYKILDSGHTKFFHELLHALDLKKRSDSSKPNKVALSWNDSLSLMRSNSLKTHSDADPESMNLVQDTNLGRVLFVYTQENKIFLLQGIDRSSYAQTESFQPMQGMKFPYHGMQLDSRFSNVFVQNTAQYSNRWTYDFNLVLIDKAGRSYIVKDKQQEVITEALQNNYNVYDLFNKQKTWTRRCQFKTDLDQSTYIRPILTCEENKGIFIELMKYEYNDGVEHESLFKQMVTGESTRRAFDSVNLSQSSSIYQISSNRLGQNYQLSSMCENKQIFRIIEYRVNSHMKQPRDTKLEIIGMKLLLPSSKKTCVWNELYPMLNENQEIIGTQIIRKKQYLKIEMPNLKNKEFKFRTDLLNATYKRYFSTSGQEEANTYLLVEASLSSQLLSSYDFFSTGEIVYLLNQGIKTILNMIPHQMNEVLMDDKQFNLFQPLEVLNGQCLCDYLVKKPSELKQRRNELEEENPKRQSLIEEFANSAENEQIMETLAKLDLIGNTQVLMVDLYQSSALDRCFDFDNVQPASADIIIEYCLSVPKSIQLEKIMMKVMPKVLRSEFSHRQFADFFVNQELIKEELPESQIQCCFTQHLLDNDLPHYSDGKEVLNKLEYLNKADLALLQHNKTQLNLPRIAGVQIKEENQKRDQGHFTIPINHFLVDTKSLRLQSKIDQMRRSETIRNKPFSDFDLAVLLMEIQAKYPNEITSMFGIRNLIDHQFAKTEIFFIAQFVLYLGGFIIPYLLQLFYFAEAQSMQTCNVICMTTMMIFYMMEILQMRDLGFINYFASDFYNYVDTASFFTYCFYFQWRMRFPENMLPQHYMGNSEDDVALESVKQMDKDDLGLMSILNCALLLIIGCKVMFYMRINESMGQLEFLVGQCLYDCSAFIIFFTFWNILFSLFYQVQGVAVDTSGYKGLNVFNRQFLQTYEDSVGNIDVPQYDFWLGDGAGKEATTIMGCMVWLIWTTWFLNQWFIFIILLNFVIAIISQSYDSVMLKSVQNKYFQRTQLNQECRLVLKSLKVKERMDQFILTANIEDDLAQADEWLGFTQTIKNFVKGENKSLKSQLQGMIVTNLQSSMSMLKNEVDKSLESKIRTELEDVKGDVEDVNYKVDNIQGDVTELKAMVAQLLGGAPSLPESQLGQVEQEE